MVSSARAQTAVELPDAPQSNSGPQTTDQSTPQSQAQTPQPGSATQPTGQTQPSQTPPPATPSTPAQSSSSSTQPSSQQSSAQETQQQKAAEEVKEQEHQRVEGVVPTFNVTYHHDAVPLSAGQKMNLCLHSAVDPFAFASAFAEAGYHEADNDLKGFPWGAKGYFERSGVAYLDTFDSDIFSTGVFPIIFRQDPRYFRMGVGTTKHRILYSLSTNFIAKNDYNGKWGPNYGNLLGNFAAGELSQFYYPSGNSSTGLAFSGAVIQIAAGAGGSIFNEFWPDLSRKFLHKDPTHGLDAQASAQYAADEQKKQAVKQENKQQQQATPPAQPAPAQPAPQTPPATPQ
jgi:hypothetical protein